MNISFKKGAKLRKINSLSNFYRSFFSYGPFKTVNFNSELCKYLVDKQILKSSVLESFILTYKAFLIALQAKNLSKLEKITSGHFYNNFLNRFLIEYCENKDIRMELENEEKISLAVENLKSYNIIYGLDLKNSSKEKIKYGEQNLIPGTYLKKILFYNKESLIRTKVFCPSITVVDVIFTTNFKPIFYQMKNNREEILYKSLNKSNESYIWQFITYSKFKNFDVPFIINLKDMEKKINLEEITNKENLNLISFFENRQKDYEGFGWKINDINNFIPSNYNSIVFS